MDRQNLALLVGGVLMLAVIAATPWVAILGVVFLWIVHRSSSGDLSKATLFRSVASGGIAGGIVTSSAVVVMQLLAAESTKDSLIHIQWPAREEGLISTVMKWTLLASTGVSVVTALLFAFAFTLVVDFFPRPKDSTNKP